MTARRLLAAAAVAALAACGVTNAPTPGLNLADPSALAVFRGVTTLHSTERTHPYLAIASTLANELVLVDAVNNAIVPGPFPLRGLVYPVDERPTLLVSGDLGDGKPDLLVAVSAGAKALQLVRTWRPDGAVVAQVPLQADVRGLVALDPDPAATGTVQVAAMLSNERIALVTFSRESAASVDPDAIRTTAQVVTSAPLGFRPVDIAKGYARGQVWLATRDLVGGVNGVVGLDLSSLTDGAAPPRTVVDALAPTRLVAAAAVRERPPGFDIEGLTTAMLADPNALSTIPVVDRVFAVLDESGCGVDAPIACGLVALDPGTGALALDPTVAGTMRAAYRAPIRIPTPIALAVGRPPAFTIDDPSYAPTTMRIVTAASRRAASAAMAVTSVDGSVWFVDLTSWEVPNHQYVQASMSVVAASNQPPEAVPAIPRNQWLVLQDPLNASTAIKHTDGSRLAAAITITPGYTPAEAWTVSKQGALPNLFFRKGEVGHDGALWLALQSAGGQGDVVRVADPTLAVAPGDIVVIDAIGVGTCGQFEAAVASVEAPTTSPRRPGGFLRLTDRVLTAADADAGKGPTWQACLQKLTQVAQAGGSGNMYVTLRAADYVLVRGYGVTARAVGRPRLGQFFHLTWSDESPAGATGTCTLPPAQPWPDSGFACDASCRARCDELVGIHQARRLFYVPEPCIDPGVSTFCGPSGRWRVWPDPTGPTIGFTLALESNALVHRDLSLSIATGDGRLPDRATLQSGATTDARAVVPYDRSRDVPGGDLRFFIAYPAGFLLDATCTDVSGSSELQ